VSRLEWLFLAGGILMYALGSAAGFAAARSGDRRRLAQARLTGAMGALYHLFVLVSLGARTGHFPVSGAEEAFLVLSTAVTGVALGLDAVRKLSLLLVGALPLALITTLLAAALIAAPGGAPTSPTPPPSAWTALHIFTAIGAYGAFAIAFVSGVLYLVAQRQLKDHASILGLMPSLQSIERVNLRAIAVGAVLLAAGILVGYAQARQLYNRQFPRLDPKIILSTLTFAAYVVLLALARRPAFRGRRAALASIAGFFLVMANFWASLFWSDFHRFR
jgi:ABC-type uncharacterized transport system permease subunit